MNKNRLKKISYISIFMIAIVCFAVFKNSIIENFQKVSEQTGSSSTLTNKDQKMYVITLRYMFENGTLAQSRDVYSFTDSGEVDENGNPVYINYTFDIDTTNASADGYIPQIDGYTPNKTVIKDTIDSGYLDRISHTNDVLLVKPNEDDYQIYKIYYTITYKPSASSYTVEEYWQNTDDNEYTLHKQNTYSDNVYIGDNAQANVTEYEGFTLNNSISTTTAKVEKGGKTTLKLYYDRNEYHVYLDSAGGTYFDPVTLKYGVTLDYSKYTPTRSGYIFDGWECINRETGETISNPTTMPANDLYFKAKWTPSKTTYGITYFIQNPDDDNYVNAGTYIVSNADTGATISDVINDSVLTTGFNSLKGDGEAQYYTYNTQKSVPNLNVKIKGDGSTDVIVYYDRKEYTLTFDIGYKSTSWFGYTNYNYYTSYTGTRSTSSAVTMVAPDGVTYQMNSQNEGPYYTITARYGQNIVSAWPMMSKITVNPSSISTWGSSYKPYGWAYVPNGSSNSVTQVSGINNLTNALIDTNGQGKTFKLVWTYSNMSYTAHYMFETLDGSGTLYNGTYFKENTEYQTKSTSNNYSHKEILHYYYNESEIEKSGYDIYLYYRRMNYKLQFHNIIESVVPSTDGITLPSGITASSDGFDVKYETELSSLSSLRLTDDQYPLTTSGSKNWTFEGWYQDEGCTIPMN